MASDGNCRSVQKATSKPLGKRVRNKACNILWEMNAPFSSSDNTVAHPGHRGTFQLWLSTSRTILTPTGPLGCPTAPGCRTCLCRPGLRRSPAQARCYAEGLPGFQPRELPCRAQCPGQHAAGCLLARHCPNSRHP